MARLGIDEKTIKKWKDQPIMLKGRKGTAVILMHGWSALPRQMLNLGKILNAEGYWVYIPLLKGHGSRPENLEAVKAENWIKDTEEAIDKIKGRSEVKKIIIGGNSMGGSLAIIGSVNRKVDGLILLGVPVHIKHHFSIWLTANFLALFNFYSKKSYPKNIKDDYPGANSYQYFPAKSVLQCLRVIKKATFFLSKEKAPILILQTNQDYMVTKYSPWIIYNLVKAKIKKLQWIQSKYESHTMTDEEIDDVAVIINNFIVNILSKDGKL